MIGDVAEGLPYLAAESPWARRSGADLSEELEADLVAKRLCNREFQEDTDLSGFADKSDLLKTNTCLLPQFSNHRRVIVVVSVLIV